MTLLEVLLFSSVAGLTIPMGAGLAWLDRHDRASRHAELHRAILAFGGGVLLAAVALVLVPEGLHDLSILPGASAFALGTLVTLALDRAIERRAGGAANAMAMVLDFVPESLALGAMFAVGGPTGPLLALLIGLQNLPEAFNGFRELEEADTRPRRAFWMLAPFAVIGPLGAVAGFLLLAGNDAAIGGLALAAAGGIIYLVFHDVAPAAFHEGHWLPTLGASLGFLAGMVGEALIA